MQIDIPYNKLTDELPIIKKKQKRVKWWEIKKEKDGWKVKGKTRDKLLGLYETLYK